jgi:glucokinase
MASANTGFVGIDFGGTNLRGGLVDSRGFIVKRAAVLTAASEGKDKVISRIVSLAQKLSAGEAFPVGVASPGPIDSSTGVLYNPPNLPGWGVVDLRKELAGRLNREVYVQNDANMTAFGEFCHGAGRGARSMLCLTVGTGIGSGLILDGHLYTGEHGLAAELGHTVIDLNGPVCGCGNRGCLESFAAAKGMVRQVRNLIAAGEKTALQAVEDELTAELIGSAAAGGDAVAVKALRRTGTYLGVAISNTLALLDIALVVLGGGIANAGELLLEPIRDAVNATLIDSDLRRPKIVPSELGDDAAILGISSYSRSST